MRGEGGFTRGDVGGECDHMHCITSGEGARMIEKGGAFILCGSLKSLKIQMSEISMSF